MDNESLLLPDDNRESYQCLISRVRKGIRVLVSNISNDRDNV